MTKKQVTTFLGFWILTISLFGFGLDWSFKNNFCNILTIEIDTKAQLQDQWLYNYAYLSGLDLKEDKIESLKRVIEIQEPLLKANIEIFAEECSSKLNNIRLVSALNSFEYYLTVKEKLFEEKQSFQWITNLMP